MMDPDKFKKLITAMVLTVMTGTIQVRIQFLGILIDHLDYFVRSEKLNKGLAPVLITRQNLVETFNFIVALNAARHKLDEKQIRAIKDGFQQHCLVLDVSWGFKDAVFGTTALREITGLQAAKMHYFHAVRYHSQFLTGSSDGLTHSTIEAESALKIVLRIVYDNNLVDVSEGEWRKAMTVQPVPPQPEPSKR